MIWRTLWFISLCFASLGNRRISLMLQADGRVALDPALGGHSVCAERNRGRKTFYGSATAIFEGGGN